MNITMKKMRSIMEPCTVYGKSKTTRKKKEECLKMGLFRVRVKGLDFEESKKAVHELRQSLYRPSGYIGLQCLSELDWGKPAEYDEIEQIYDDYICIPKDFSNPKGQLEAILKSAAMKMYEIKLTHNLRSRSKLNSEEL